MISIAHAGQERGAAVDRDSTSTLTIVSIDQTYQLSEVPAGRGSWAKRALWRHDEQGILNSIEATGSNSGSKMRPSEHN